jgi:glycosyltransferase involved in cell wall biosynthesis
MILFQLIQKPQQRGAELFASQLSEELKKLGHTVYLISLFEGTYDFPYSGPIIYLNRPISKRWYDVKGWKMLASLIRLHKPDIVQCNAGDTLKWAVLSKTLFGWNSLIVARNASTVSSYITSSFIKKINSYLYSNTAAIFSVSEHSKNDLVTLFPATKSKTYVIPIGVSSALLQNVELQGNSDVNLIHVGGFTFEKNHLGLLSIFESFLKKQPTAVLHLLGDGPLRKEIELQIASRGLGNCVFLYGWVARPYDYIAKADVLVLPSIIEGLPAVILEAMYCRTPVVAYNVGGISEIVTSKSGFLVSKGDEIAFVEAINNLFLNNCKDIIATAYEIVHANFSNPIIAIRFEKEYQNLKKRYVI